MPYIQWVATIFVAIFASTDSLDTIRALRSPQVLSSSATVVTKRAGPDPAKISNLTQEIVDLAKKAEEKKASDDAGAATDDARVASDGASPSQAAAPDPPKVANLTQEIANLAKKALEAANETRKAAKAIQAKAIQDGQQGTVVRASSPQSSNPLGIRVPDSPANCAGDASDCAVKAAEAAKLAKAAAKDFMDHNKVSDEMVKEVVNHVRTAKRLAETNVLQAQEASNEQKTATELADAENRLEAKASGGQKQASQDDKSANKEYTEVKSTASTDEHVPSAAIMLSARRPQQPESHPQHPQTPDSL